jgi:predicted AlkP superfamily pyrophosphatase or phosphodiesterase
LALGKSSLVVISNCEKDDVRATDEAVAFLHSCRAAADGAADKRLTTSLTFVHLDAVDGAGHAHGWGSAAYHTSIAIADLQVERLLRAAGANLPWPDTTGMAALSTKAPDARGSTDDNQTLVIVASDHGGLGTNHGDLNEPNMRVILCAFVLEDATNADPVSAAANGGGGPAGLGPSVPSVDERMDESAFVSTLDIAPTVLSFLLGRSKDGSGAREHLSIPPPLRGSRSAIRGVSLL